MAFLADRVNGTSQGTINQAWYNDAKHALTGVMTDQAFNLTYNPGSSTSTPAVQIVGNGNGPFLQVLNGAALQFQVDSIGNTHVYGRITSQQTLGGSFKSILYISPTDVGTKTWQLNYNTDNSLTFTDLTDTNTCLQMFTDGSVAIGIVDNGTPSLQRIFTNTATPTGANNGDIWIKA